MPLPVTDYRCLRQAHDDMLEDGKVDAGKSPTFARQAAPPVGCHSNVP